MSELEEFDHKTIEKLGFYVYGLIDPDTNSMFYIGKGSGNRVFMHVRDAIEGDESSLKLDKIRDIISRNKKVKHIILRSGLKESESLEIEATLIDIGNYFDYDFSNIVLGQHSNEKGLMTSDELIRKHNAKTLNELYHPVIIININRNYKRGINRDDIYAATKEAWVLNENIIPHIKYALAEYEGIIIEVYKINKWLEVDTKDFNDRSKVKIKHKKRRWGFDGEIAEDEVRNKYLNKSIAWSKKRGSANPIRYRLDKPNLHLEELLKKNKKKSVNTKKAKYDGMKIGQYVRKLFLRLNEEKKLSDIDIINLQDPNYCKKTFNAGFPVLIKNTKSKKDHLGETRYYKDEYIDGYWLSAQWIDKQFEKLRKWEKHVRL